MRRFYIAPKTVWLAAHHSGLFHPIIGSAYIDLVDFASGEQHHTNEAAHAHFESLGLDVANHAHAKLAFHCASAEGSTYVLVSTDFHSEYVEDAWESHEHVAVLPHPTFEGNDKIATHIDSPTKKLKARHVGALEKHSTLGFDLLDTVHSLAAKAAVIHPGMKLRHIL